MKVREFEPMKAESLDGDVAKVPRWPMLWSPKLDGIRCVVRNGVALSYNLKPIRNEYVQSRIGRPELNGMDGELIVGEPTGGEVFNRTLGVMAREGKPDFTFWVFDDFSAHAHDFLYRIGRVEDRIDDVKAARLPLALVEHQEIHGPGVLPLVEEEALRAGYEGVMLRDPSGPYKHGRATAREGWLFKVKRFKDSEAVITGIEEGRTNTNAAEADAFGRVKRSTHKDKMVPNGQVGTLLGQCLETGAPLRISPGRLTQDQRKHYWAHPEQIIGRLITHSSFLYGVKDAPRFSNFKCFRDPSTFVPPQPAV